MAGLLSTFPKRVKVLDPGAGTGTLSAAICNRVLALSSPHHLEIHLFETDASIIPLLDENMKNCRSALRERGHRMSYDIHQADYILSNAHAFGQHLLFDSGTELGQFDLVIMNPPYFKVGKDSQYAQIMYRLVHGQPNIYALFMALGAEMLRPGGQLVAITPRSFCSGLYFRGFRRWFFDRMSLRHIHLFESRTDTFREANVLQESVITLTQRLTKQPASIAISTSYGRDLPKEPAARQIAANKVIDAANGSMVVRIPENAQDALVMELVEAWPKRFLDLGLRVSTGPVVMFRARQFLLDSLDAKDAVPLLSVHNVHPFQTVWPVPKKNKPTGFKACAESRRLLVPTRNYVLLRRFTAKEERRRLVASCFLKNSEARPYVALENHLNYIYHQSRELTDHEVYGLAALFNSALLDRYFRTISGNTQVNATELRTINFPDLNTIARIGRHIVKLEQAATREAERIVAAELGANGPLQQYLTGLVT